MRLLCAKKEQDVVEYKDKHSKQQDSICEKQKQINELLEINNEKHLRISELSTQV